MTNLAGRKKLLSILSSIVIMVCLGGLYAWSIYVPLLKAEHGLSTAQTQVIFGVTIAVFTVTMIPAGRLLEKLGPRLTTCVAALLFGTGYLTASFSDGNFTWLVVGIGALSGAGLGFGYVCALTTPLRWISRRKGLMTGMTVAGFGAGAILLSQAVEALTAGAVPVLQIFRSIGISYGAVVFLCALLLFSPRDTLQERTEMPPGAPGSALSGPFWTIAGGMFAGTFAGLLVMGNLKPMGLSFGISEQAATLAIAVVAVGNATGRVLWGYIFDKLGGRRSIVMALLFLSVSTLALLSGGRYEVGFLLASFAVGLGFGANFVLFAAQVSRVYGVDRFSAVYPLVFLAYGAAGILGPLAGGWVFDVLQTYYGAIVAAATICAAGAAGSYFLTSYHEDAAAGRAGPRKGTLGPAELGES